MLRPQNSRAVSTVASNEVASSFGHMRTTIGAPRSLRELGLNREDLDRAAEIATRTPYFNPRPVTRDAIRQLLEDAYNAVVPSP